MKKLIYAISAAALLLLGTNVSAQEETKPLREKTNLTFSAAVKDPETKQPTGEFKARWPFVTPSSKEITKNIVFIGEEFTAKADEKRHNLEVKILSKQGVKRDKNGLVMGGKDSYVEFPAKETMSIVYVRLDLVNPDLASVLQVVDAASLEPVKGGEACTVKEGKTYFRLRTQPGKALRLVITADETVQFRSISADYREPKKK